ncbi:uncharacterized protein LOC134205253 [Armigeres subalbatus]|uniref:uncharacterized protein LOC134205253 n=1 Tax=Armigeres subalbatus TaxID=124917 RepID=UPI002ED45962
MLGFARFYTGPFWENLAEQLNSLGPPIKDPAGWKKVWADWKSNLKRKLANNRKEQQATGGGPNRIIEFSALEERVIDLAGLTAAVEGIDNSIAFGAPVEEDENDAGVANGTFPEAADDADAVEDAPDTGVQEQCARRKRRAPSSLNLLDTQVKQQKKIHNEIIDVLRTQTKKFGDLAYYGKTISKRLMDLQALETEN